AITTVPFSSLNNIYGNISPCPGSTQTYFVNPVPGTTSYTWNLPSGWSGNSLTNSITVVAGLNSGDISVRANNSCGGSGAYTSLQVFIDTMPSKPGTINGNAYVATGEKHDYSVDVARRPSGYNWALSGGGNLTVGQSPHKIEVGWQTPGTYVLSVNAVNSCGVSTEQKMNITVSGANEKDSYGLQLVPNPSTGQIFLKARRVQDKLINVAVLNMAGQCVFRSGKRQGTNDYSQLINLDKMAIGLYAVKIMIDDKTYVRSVMIKH
ncbi:MAG TPA: T9SS type A sorting domain-containing protein, partial [Chitinophagaceae bacterium]|nr:T9SS type A sorting domain-containing protein [Chitinophagaceae bacterium]